MAALVGRGLGMFATFGEKFGAIVGKTALKEGARLTEDAIKDSAKVSEKLISKGVKFEGEHIGGELKDVGYLTKFAAKVVEKGAGSLEPDSSESKTFDALKNLAKKHEDVINGNKNYSDGDATKVAKAALARAHGIEMDDHMQDFYNNNQTIVDNIAHMHAHDAALKVKGDEQRKKMATEFANEHTSDDESTDVSDICSKVSGKLDKLYELIKNVQAPAPSEAAPAASSKQQAAATDEAAAKPAAVAKKSGKISRLKDFSRQHPRALRRAGNLAAAGTLLASGHAPLIPVVMAAREALNYRNRQSDLKKKTQEPTGPTEAIGNPLHNVDSTSDQSDKKKRGGSKRIIRSYKNKKTVNKKKRSKYTKRKTVNKRKRTKYTKRKTKKRKRITKRKRIIKRKNKYK